jgi:TonB family protein
MPAEEFKGASPNAHLLVGEMPAPHTLETSSWRATAASFAAHVVVLAALIYGALHVRQIAKAVQDPIENFVVIMRPEPGPGGGGGGRPAPPKPEPPKKAEIVQTKPVQPTPIPKPADVPDLNIPVQTPNATATIPGAVSMSADGVGAAGGGKGTGIGTGNGNGLGPGEGGGFGGGAYAPGNGISDPTLIHEVKPNYTGDAMRAKIQGVVEMDAVVLPDGTIDPRSLKVTRSLDATFGLDEEAKKAVRQWKFRPAVCNRPNGCGQFKPGQPVPVLVSVELTFTLR